MNSGIYWSNVMHIRLQPCVHEFTYPLFYLLIDLDELANFNSLLLNYNKFGLFSIFDSDYVNRNQGSIKSKILAALKNYGFNQELDKIKLLTVPRYFNYTFNPVSFYYCYKNEKLIYHIAEINNTFDERHLYILENKSETSESRYQTNKTFHVSPFNDLNGEYKFYFSELKDTLNIRIDIIKNSVEHFRSNIRGNFISLSTGALLKTIIKFPLSAALNMPRILWEAFKLNYVKKLKVYQKPAPSSTFTLLHARPNRIQNFAKKAFINALSKLKHGALELVLPDQERLYFGNKQEKPAQIIVLRYSFFVDVLYDSHVGLGESFSKGDWTSPDLTDVILTLAKNEEFIGSRLNLISVLGASFDLLTHYLHRNTLAISKRNIRKHYDLSNEMFSLFLDSSMTYSSGIFDAEHKDLGQAQINKLRTLIDKAQITSEHHVLEIGSGWGSLAIECAKRTGCKVTTITISEKQYEYARQKIIAEGLADRIDIRICDYRELEGKFDRIISCEMLEAVGKEFLGTFFNKCESLLNPDGLLVIQVITMSDANYQVYSSGCDWIQKHIFPGAHLPSVNQISKILTKDTKLSIEDMENIGIHYAKTLRIWRTNLEAKLTELKQLGFDDEFYRKWYYYFSYCEAGFKVRRINNMQLVLSRQQNMQIKDSRLKDLVL